MADENYGSKNKKALWLAIVIVIFVLIAFGYHYRKSRGEIIEVPLRESNGTGSEHVIVGERSVIDRHDAIPQDEKIEEPGKNDTQEGIKLYAKEKYEEAKEFLEKAAAEGNADAKALLGKMYVMGQGVVHDVKKGLEYLEDAAERGSSYAMAELGQLYVEGRHGVEKAADKGMEFIRRSINAGGYYGHLAMARLYEVGDGVERNVEKAIEYLEEAGRHGYKNALDEIEKIKEKLTD